MSECQSNNGQWRCATCGAKFRNNLEASGHEQPGHDLVWFCFDHGVVEAA
ncbi:MAG: hypothetical protein QOD63_79 [Actinomycetota bacterium]|nr:hypothetical protein [Actinomycetota bacterium]